MKNPVYQIRVKAEMLEFLNEAGPEVVRGWWRQRMSGVVREERALITAPIREKVRDKASVPAKTSLKAEAGVAQNGVPASETNKWAAAVAANEAKLAARKALEARRGLSASFGEAAPVADAPVSAPRSKVFEQSEEDRAKKMALLRSVATGMKMQPQMEKPVDPYALGDAEPNDDPA